MDMEVFIVSGSPYAWRVQLAMEFKKASYTIKTISFSEGENQRPEYLALNPRGKVPTLRDGAIVLPESLAIMNYLEKKYSDDPMFGATPEETARIWKVVSESTCYFEPAIPRIVLPIFRDQIEENADDIKEAAVQAHEEIAKLDAMLNDRDWLGGGKPSGADLVVLPFIEILLRGAGLEAAKPLKLGFDNFAETYPALDAWRKRAEGLPGYARAYPAHWKKAA